MADAENPVKQWMTRKYKFLHNQYVKGHRLLWARAHKGKKQWRVPGANQYPCVGATNACMASDTFLRQRWHMRVQVFIYMSIPFKADSNDQTPTNWRWWGVSSRVRATIIVSRRQPHIYCRTTFTFGWQCMYQTWMPHTHSHCRSITHYSQPLTTQAAYHMIKLPVSCCHCFLGRYQSMFLTINQSVQQWTTKLLILWRQGGPQLASQVSWWVCSLRLIPRGPVYSEHKMRLSFKCYVICASFISSVFCQVVDYFDFFLFPSQFILLSSFPVLLTLVFFMI